MTGSIKVKKDDQIKRVWYTFKPAKLKKNIFKDMLMSQLKTGLAILNG